MYSIDGFLGEFAVQMGSTRSQRHAKFRMREPLSDLGFLRRIACEGHRPIIARGWAARDS